MGSNGVDKLSLDSIRKTLIELEDTIVFSLIERAKFPLNSRAHKNGSFPGICGSLLDHLVRGIEVVQSQGGRYQSPEEVPFFPKDLPPPLVNHGKSSQELPRAASSVSVNKKIWEFYVNQFLPLLAPKGDDGNYALSTSSDLVCLQTLSRRIHFGKYVAEVKFRSDPQGYSAAIRAKDKDTLMKFLTDEKVEAMVKQRVAKKAMVFGQDVFLSGASNNTGKVDPALVYRLYNEWVIPLTKDVEVEYLLRRLD
ncbi:chorismate mutase 2-like [Silene latifolia]|uniref:chorismate mutase 2-like n=1 Tax=Silene latifolia TaxID=37657 RepID=UPI003D7721B3